MNKLTAAETALANAIRNGATDDELYELDAATISAELAESDASLYAEETP